MKIAVMGAGAVGCYYGGMLARAGHAVTLIGRPQHVAAIRREGLWLDTQSFQARVELDASESPSAVAGAQLVLFCVKSTDTESAGAQIAPHLAADALVLSLQNGVDNAERLQAGLRQQVAPAVVYVATEMAGPGHVKHHGRGELVIGPEAARDDIVALFRAAGVPLQVSDNVVGALWAKLILNCAYNALSALAQLPYGRLVQGVGVEAVMADVVQECLAVAAAAGVDVPGDTREAVRRIALTMPTQFSSTAQDLARGKPSEIDHLNGYVLRRGAALGVPTPVNRVLHTLVRLVEAGRHPAQAAV
ncbi:ketopantoate reductase family protein [Caldimonas brevitalea]|uniref:2-dehydropantoate 2-reductase n=1 Tax=Caldimonas brevitalea TaxID=413882 RepID=A0A0G3BWU7_9BURK|nr:ketopantoate reductase family protein [Caldimonas brevitalea]AKJ31836.1 2-dehydropantoate 2-reductase [Caldimonas brevitalea]